MRSGFRSEGPRPQPSITPGRKFSSRTSTWKGNAHKVAVRMGVMVMVVVDSRGDGDRKAGMAMEMVMGVEGDHHVVLVMHPPHPSHQDMSS